MGKERRTHEQEVEYLTNKFRVQEILGNKCPVCGRTTKLTAHHYMVPRRDGGSDKKENLFTLCESCHKRQEEIEARAGRKSPDVRDNRGSMRILFQRKH